MRDLERWKDKVELSLDGRQVFFLFFGSAVAVCLVFVLGVVVGKRMQTRALALSPAPVEDPLAALDQLSESAEADEGLTYHRTLTRKAEPARPAVKAADKPAEPPAAVPVKPQATAVEPAAKPPVAAAPAKPATVEPAPKPQLAAAAPANKPVALPKLPAPPPVKAVAPTPIPGHFTLQLGAYPEKSDADDLVRKMLNAGYKPFVIASEIPGKGTFYRVRVGDFVSKQAALDAKTDFEKKQRMVVYVAKL